MYAPPDDSSGPLAAADTLATDALRNSAVQVARAATQGTTAPPYTPAHHPALDHIRPASRGAENAAIWSMLPATVKFHTRDRGTLTLPRGDEYTLHRPVDDNPGWVEQYNPQTKKWEMVAVSDDAQTEKLKQQAISKAFALDRATMDDLMPHRIRAAYRIVRQMARLNGQIDKASTLVQALGAPYQDPITQRLYIDPWSLPVPPSGPREGENMWPECERLRQEALQLPEDLQCRGFNFQTGKLETYPGLPLIPPPVPGRYMLPSGEIRPDYDPSNPDTPDPLLHLYVQMIGCVAARLCLPEGSKFNPDGGRYGMAGLTNVRLVRAAFPTRLQIVAWETLLAEEALDYLVETSVPYARKELSRRHGLQPIEIDVTPWMAMSLAQSHTSYDMEACRGLMILRWEDYIRRAKDALDTRAEALGLKELASIQGLASEGQGDFFEGMVDAIRSVASERSAVHLRELPMTPEESMTRTVENTANARTF